MCFNNNSNNKSIFTHTHTHFLFEFLDRRTSQDGWCDEMDDYRKKSSLIPELQ